MASSHFRSSTGIYHFVPDLAKSHYLRKTYLRMSRQSCIELQSDIDSMYKWSQLWQMDFNVIKCYIHVISFTRSKNPILFDYTMNGVPLQRVDEIRDLGVIITSSLS